jgi:hypothetical protein
MPAFVTRSIATLAHYVVVASPILPVDIHLGQKRQFGYFLEDDSI